MAGRWAVVLPVVVFLTLSLLGVTSSSIGTDALREDPEHPRGLIWGESVPIRRDEYLTSSPLLLGVAATGSSQNLNPLSAPQRFITQLPAGPASALINPDGTLMLLGPWLPDSMLFAAHWWFPLLLLALGAPACFRMLTGSRSIGWFAVAMIVLSPANAWWSWAGAALLGPVFAGAAALQLAARHLEDGRRARSAGYVVLSSILLARAATNYLPWVIVLVPAVLLPVVASLLRRGDGHRARLRAVVLTAYLTLGLLALVFFENRVELRAGLATVYPGQRLTSGQAVPIAEFFSAPLLVHLRSMSTFVETNESEISSSFLFCLVWALVLVLARRQRTVPGLNAARWTLVTTTTFWVVWSSFDLGATAARLPLANRVPAFRAADVLGYLGVVLLCLVLPTVPARGPVGRSLLAALSCAAVTIFAGVRAQETRLPELTTPTVWLAGALVATAVLTISLRPRRPLGYVVSCLLALTLVWNVNPVLFGLGDLRSSHVAEEFMDRGREARASGETWATDSKEVDALLAATGVPSASSRQIAGPDKTAWRALDPQDENEEMWNRGGAYIRFSWTTSSAVTFENPSPDVIDISVSPCELARRMPSIAHVVASAPLEGSSCLSQERVFRWAGEPRWVYAVE